MGPSIPTVPPASGRQRDPQMSWRFSLAREGAAPCCVQASHGLRTPASERHIVATGREGDEVCGRKSEIQA
jgi:hypothetical protein